MKQSHYLYPAALAVIFMSSLLIIVSPIGSKTIIPVPVQPTPTPTSVSASKSISIISPDLKLPVKSPLKITGKIDRSWVFEAIFPIELFDDQGKSLYQGNGSAPGWSTGTERFVNFTADLSFVTDAATGYLEIRNDNPSGLPQNSKSITFPIIFSNARH